MDKRKKKREDLQTLGDLLLSTRLFLAPAGLTLGIGATAATALVATASAVTPRPWTTAPAWWGKDLREHVFGSVMQVEFRGTTSASPVQPEEFAICIANHPGTFALPEFLYAFSRYVSPSMVAVAKHDLEWILRIPCGALGVTIPINRDDRVGAKRIVQERIPDLARHSAALLVFPDTTRPTQEKREKARKKWLARIPDFDNWSTLPPRSGVLLAILQSLPYPVRVFNMTHGFNVFDETWGSFWNLPGATYHAQVSSLWSNELPCEENELQLWLNEEWRRKNDCLRKWRSSSCP